MNKTQIHYLLANWRLLIHLLLKTKYFGVNNRWWSPYPSPVGINVWQQLKSILLIRPLMRNYQSLRMRAYSGWVSQETAKKLFNS